MHFDPEIQKCLQVLRSGGTLLYPTDTIWGIGCDATNENAVEKIYRIKKRSESKSLIALVSDIGMLNRFVKDIPSQAWDLIELSDSPLTIIYDSGRGFAKNVFGEDGSIAVRLVKDEFCQRMIHRFGRPIVSTSANISGENAPKDFYGISEEIKLQVDHVADWRQNDHAQSKPSSIIKLKANGEFVIVRK